MPLSLYVRLCFSFHIYTIVSMSFSFHRIMYSSFAKLTLFWNGHLPHQQLIIVTYVYNSGKVSSNTEGSKTLTYLALVGTLSSRNKSTSDGSWTKNRRCIQIYDLNFRNFFRIEDETPWTISPIKIYKCMLWCVISSWTLVYVQW